MNSHKEMICVGVGGAVGIRVVQEVLDSQQDLLDGDGGLPSVVLIQDGQTHRSRGVHIWVEEGRCEFACEGGKEQRIKSPAIGRKKQSDELNYI